MRKQAIVLLAVGLAVTLAACLDFDARFEEGVARLSPDASVPDAALPACEQPLCEYGFWKSTGVIALRGLVSSSAADVVALTADVTDRNDPNAEFVAGYARPAADGGFALSGSSLPSQVESPTILRGTPSDFWLVFGDVVHVVNGTEQSVSKQCGTQPQAGSWESAQVLPSGAAVLFGDGFQVCRVEPTGASSLLVDNDPTGSHSPWIHDGYLAPDGQVFFAGWDGRVHGADGGALSPVLNTTGSYGLLSMSGVAGDQVWTVGSDGKVAARQADGGFENVVTLGGGKSLSTVYAIGPNDVWAGGEGPEVLHWNGTGWQRVTLPHLSSNSWVFAISGDAHSLHFGGNLTDYTGFLLSYRRGP